MALTDASSSAADSLVVGVDAGATLCKVAPLRDRKPVAFPAGDLGAIWEYLRGLGKVHVAATGGGASRVCSGLSGTAVRIVPEFEAWVLGAPILASGAGIALPERYLLVSLGTGTSILSVRGTDFQRAGGSALGGGALIGLAKLMCRVDSFTDLLALASRGDRRKVDLLVGDIYTHGDPPIPAHFNAASFGKLESTHPEDLAHALMGLVGENIGILCGTTARAHHAETILYCGSTLENNEPLKEILSAVSYMYGVTPQFLPNGAYCGAVGAAAHGSG